MLSVNQVVRPCSDAFLAEIRQAKRTLPAFPAIVGIVEPGWANVDVFHARCESEVGIGEVDTSRAVLGRLPARLGRHLGHNRIGRRLQAVWMLYLPCLTAIQAPRQNVLRRSVPIDGM